MGGREDEYDLPHFFFFFFDKGRSPRLHSCGRAASRVLRSPHPRAQDSFHQFGLGLAGALCNLLGVFDALCRVGLLTGMCWRFVMAVYAVTGCIREACTSWERVAGMPSQS